MCPHPLDVAAVGSRASQAQPDHVHEQAGDPQQVHGISDECGGDNVVDEEGAVIWQKDAPAETQWFSVSGNNRQTVGWKQNITHSNRTLASARNFLSKSQRKKTSRLESTDRNALVEVKGQSGFTLFRATRSVTC